MSMKDCCVSFLFACRIAHCVAQGLSREQPVNPRYRSADSGSEPGAVGCWRDIEVFKPMVFRRFSLMLADASWVWHIFFDYIHLFRMFFAHILMSSWGMTGFLSFSKAIKNKFESKLASGIMIPTYNIQFISIHVGNTPAWWTGMILH